jgi:hypothetical protein
VGLGQRSTLTGPRPGSVGPGLGRIWAGLGQARSATWRTQALPRRTDGFQTSLARVGVAHRGLCGVGCEPHTRSVVDRVHLLFPSLGLRCTDRTVQCGGNTFPIPLLLGGAPVHAAIGMVVMSGFPGGSFPPS